MTTPREPRPPSPLPESELDVELELDPLEIELEFDDVPSTSRSSSVEISYADAETSATHAAFADAREVARRATVKRRARSERLALVGTDRETRVRRAEFLRALAEDARGNHRARLLLAAAELFETVGDPRAARMLENAIAEEPVDPVALRARRRLASKAGKRAETIGALRREVALPLGPLEKAVAHALLADQLEAAGDEAALASTRHAHEAAPDSAAMSVNWVHAAARAGDNAEAVRALVAAIKRVQSPRLRGLLALELSHRAERAENAEAALAWAEAALNYSSELLAAHLVAIRSSRKIGDAASVRRHVTALASRVPDGPARSALLRWTARYARAHGEGTEAVAKTLKLPTSSADFRLLAELSLRAGDLATARRHLARAAELSSNAPRAAVFRDLAMLELRMGDREGALAAAREASRADPGSPLEGRLRAFLGDTLRSDDPLGRAAKAAVGSAVETELEALLAAREVGEAPLAAELVATNLRGLGGDRGALAELLALELGRRPRDERRGLALASALLRANMNDVKGALAVLQPAQGDPLVDRLAAELRGEPVPDTELDVGASRHAATKRLIELVLEGPTSAAAALHRHLDAFERDPALLALVRRAADTPAIQEARRAALEGGHLTPVSLGEAALLALGRAERGEKNPFARALLARADAGSFEQLVAARVVELSHAPLEAAKIRSRLPESSDAALIGSRLALRGNDAALAESLAGAALASHPGSVAAARALEVAAMEADSAEALARAEHALVEMLAPTDDGIVAARLLHHASKLTPTARSGLQRAAKLYAHSSEVTRRAESAIRAMPDLREAVPLLERHAKSYETARERASVLVRVAQLAESAGDLDTARRLLSDAVSEERLHPAAAEELARVEARRGDPRASLDALAIASEASNVTTRKASLLHRAARVAETELADLPLALSLLSRALSFDPERAETLDRAIALKQSLGEEIPAAWLAERASASEPAGSGEAALTRVELHRRAGQRDLAFAKLEEILRADPGHAGALRASVELELEEGRPERAIGHAKTLIEAATRDEDRLFAHVTMARLMDEHRGDVAGSAAHYTMALDLSPRDGALRGKLAAAKLRLREPTAGEELRAAVEDLRRAIERRPDRPEGWEALVGSLAACGFAGPAATIEGVAAALGTLPARPHRYATAPLEASLLDRVAPRGVSGAARAFFVSSQRIFAALAPFQPERWSASKLDTSHPVARELAKIGGNGGCEVLVSARVPLACVPGDHEGRTIVLGRDLVERFGADELRFLAAGAHALSIAGLSPVLQLNRADLERCIGAIFAALEIDAPGYESFRTGPFVDAAKRLLAAPDEPLKDAALRLARDAAFDPSTIVDATMRLGYRAALARLGDGKAAVEALLKLYGVGSTSGRELIEATRAVPTAWDVVLFSMSPACIDVRRRAGAPDR